MYIDVLTDVLCCHQYQKNFFDSFHDRVHVFHDSGVSFNNANAQGASFVGANMRGCDIENCNLEVNIAVLTSMR